MSQSLNGEMARTRRADEAESAVDRAVRAWARARRTVVELAEPWQETGAGGRACVLVIAGAPKTLECGASFSQEAVGELREVQARVFRALDALLQPTESHALLTNSGVMAGRRAYRF
jgi:hypothetical protein